MYTSYCRRPPDQHYLSIIKLILISLGKLKNTRELIFVPSGGSKGIRTVACMLSSKDDNLPAILFDSDEQGRAAAKKIKFDLYAGQEELVLEVSDFIRNVVNAEIEDLFPPELLSREMDRWYREEISLSDILKSGKSIIQQIEEWALSQKIKLASPGWKVDLAKRVKQSLLRNSKVIPEEYLNIWESVFSKFESK